MRLDKLDLNLLVALDALLAEMNITRAAERLHLSQSAMSNALGRLREYFGDPLLVQVQRRMEVTPRAQALKGPVRDVIARIRAAIATDPVFEPASSDRIFDIVASDYCLHTVVPRLLALAATRGSTVQFRFQALTGSPTRALDSGEADLLVIPEDYCSSHHPSECLFEERFVCVVWNASGHARDGLSLERYLQAHHVVMVPPPHAATKTYESKVMARSGITRHVGVSTYSFASMPLMVVGTPYVATIHSRLAEAAAKQHPLLVLPCPVEIPPMPLHVQWHEFRSSDPGLTWLRALLREAVASC